MYLFQAIYECIFATKVKCFGDLPDYNDCNLIIMNHRTRFDWLYLFSYQVRFGSIKRYSITLKNILKLAPGVGKPNASSYCLTYQILVSKKAKIKNPYNQVPHLTQDITWESDKKTREFHIQASQEVSPFPAGDHKAAMKRQESMINTKQK